MNLQYAISKLYETGWSPRDGRLLHQAEDGRMYPAVVDVKRVFEEDGLKLTLKNVTLFNCYRAEWPGGYCVGSTENEAAVYALAKLLETRKLMALEESNSAYATQV